MMNKETAHVILDRAHAAWSGGDVQGVLDCYADDFVYWCNTGGPNGTPLTITGRAAMAAFLSPVVEVAESMSVVDSFEYQAPIGRAQVSCFIRHKLTGHVLTGSYRQIVTFDAGHIARMEEFHDAARMAAFWCLVTTEAAELKSRSNS